MILKFLLIKNLCIDFFDKNFCDKYNDMTWSNKTCHESLDYKWDDKIKYTLLKNPGLFVMFDKNKIKTNF